MPICRWMMSGERISFLIIFRGFFRRWIIQTLCVWFNICNSNWGQTILWQKQSEKKRNKMKTEEKIVPTSARKTCYDSLFLLHTRPIIKLFWLWRSNFFLQKNNKTKINEPFVLFLWNNKSDTNMKQFWCNFLLHFIPWHGMRTANEFHENTIAKTCDKNVTS